MLGIDRRAARYAWTAALVLLLICTIYLIRETLLVFVIALLFAYLLYPLMDLIDRRLTSKTRTPALAMTFTLFIGVLAVFGTFIGSVVASQAANLTKESPVFLERLRQNPTTGPQTCRFSQEIQVIAANRNPGSPTLQRHRLGRAATDSSRPFGLDESDLYRYRPHSQFLHPARWASDPR